jgi:hypothetical protein
VLSAGLYALEAFDPSWALDHEVQAFGEASALRSARSSTLKQSLTGIHIVREAIFQQLIAHHLDVQSRRI